MTARDLKLNPPLPILIASDHAGFKLKSQLISYLQTKYQVIDFGCNQEDSSVDYPFYAQKLAKNLGNSFGILICGSGIGISIAANRFKNVRAALCRNEQDAYLARLHNDSNVLCLGGRSIEFDTAFKITEIFLNQKFDGGRHQKRIDDINNF